MQTWKYSFILLYLFNKQDLYEIKEMIKLSLAYALMCEATSNRILCPLFFWFLFCERRIKTFVILSFTKKKKK